MGVQRIQETSTASYGKSVETAAAGNSSAAGSGSATGGTTQTVENITTPWKAENKNSTDTKNSLSARNDKDEEQETLSEYHVGPVRLGGNERAVHADDESSYRADKSEQGLFPAMELSLFLNQSKYNGKGNEQKGNASGCAVDSCGGG